MQIKFQLVVLVNGIDVVLIEELINLGIVIGSVGVIVVLGIVQYEFKVVVVQVQVYVCIVGLF